MAIKPRREVEATDATVDIVNGGSVAAITFLTMIESDLTLLVPRPVLERLRSQIAFELTRTTPPSHPE